MSRGINKCIIIGTAGKDPEIKYTQGQLAITSFSMATSESYKDKQTGQKVEKTEWHNITMFGKLAEITAEYVKKGSKIYIEGKLKTDKWKDKDTGKDVYKTSIVANEMQMLGGKSESNNDQSKSSKPQWSNDDHNIDDLKDDDIPF
jgi:single-strand DNA-binding protein